MNFYHQSFSSWLMDLVCLVLICFQSLLIHCLIIITNFKVIDLLVLLILHYLFLFPISGWSFQFAWSTIFWTQQKDCYFLWKTLHYVVSIFKSRSNYKTKLTYLLNIVYPTKYPLIFFEQSLLIIQSFLKVCLIQLHPVVITAYIHFCIGLRLGFL